MLRGPSLLLLCVLPGALAAQSPHVVVTPGVSHAWFGVIYQGSIYLRVPIFQSPFQSTWYSNGKVVEARGMFSAVHHHTAGLDGGFSPRGPSGNWAGNLGIGVGAQVAF